MGLIPDQRPRDWAYMATFDKKDLPFLEEMARHIRETHDTAMIEDFNLKCEQKLTGQAAVLDNGIEIQSVTKTEDLVVNTGLQQCINIIIGTSSTRWSHFGIGADYTGVAVTNTALLSETLATRVLLAWAEPIGMRMFFGAISSQTEGFKPTSASEIGVYNGSAAGAVLLNRSGFRNPPTQQFPGGFTEVVTAPIVVSAVIEFCPVA
ncbi:MAG TPA: hypothetical protein VLG09_02350 [Candidatus Saccharimonadales bacterium]|nr:hypothetical protein [Candidatus Saccharimonadales bacterium]